MAYSPVEFAAAFERFRTHVGAVDADDSALLQLLDFWQKLAPLRENPAYSSYVAEYLAFLEAALTDDNLRDLSLAELAGLESLGSDVGAREPLLQLIRRQIARQCFFVDKLDEGLAACLRITREEVAIDTSDDSGSGLSEFETFYTFVTAFNEKWPATKKLLQELVEEWQAEREFVSTGRVYCLFVQNNGLGERSRGKLRALSGSVEERNRSAQNDEITFDNQLRSSDDPMVGVAYQALVATRRYLKATGYARLGSSYYHAHFAVSDKRAVYTGDSIGVATALLAYAQLLHTEALRHDHLLPGDVACTGGIDEAGTVTPVNGGSLHAKVERAFFSHIKYLVLPSENIASARKHLEALQSRFPARQLILLPIASLSAAVNDHNIIRPEKVCIGEFVAKKAVKYSRSTTVQVPMLMVLAYLLLCVIYPKAWVGFDWNVTNVRVFENHIEASNVDNRVVWKDDTFEHSMSTGVFGSEASFESGESYTVTIADFNDDGSNEVLFAPPYVTGEQPPVPTLRYYDRDGTLLWHHACIDTTKYPGDTKYPDIRSYLAYSVNFVKPIRTSDSSFVFLTISLSSTPARAQVMLFDLQGDKVSGPYLHTGFLLPSALCADVDGDGGDEIVLSGGNNRLGRAIALALNPFDMSGVSPPYDNELFRISGMNVGSQKIYVVFPDTRLSQFSKMRSGVAAMNRVSSQDNCLFKFVLLEAGGMKTGDTVITSDLPFAPKIDYWFNSQLDPTSVTFPDGGFHRLNAYIGQLGQPPYESQDSLERELLEGVQVLRRN